MIYSLCGGMLCLIGMIPLCALMKGKNLWFVSVIGAVLHNLGQIIADVFIMQSVHVFAYFPFLLVTGCIAGLFTGFAADRVVKHLPALAFPARINKAE